MPIKKRISGKKRYLRSDVLLARASLSNFTKEKPMMASQAMYDDIVKTGELDDMLDRLAIQRPIPTKFDC